jgi:sirohydrochlorin ferrochelatase
VTSGIVVFAHGSRVESANQSVRLVASELARAGNFPHVEAAFLELGEPDLAGAVAKLVEQGVERILVLPYFLTLGLHMERDLPRLTQAISNRYRGLEILVGPPLEGHRALIDILLDRSLSILRSSKT